MAVTRETLEELLAQRRHIDSILDARQRELVRAWVRAWDEINATMVDAINDIVDPDGLAITRARRSAEALRAATQQIGTLSAQTALHIVGDAKALINKAGRDITALIGAQLPANHAALGVKLSGVDRRQLEVIVERTAQQITSRARILSVEAATAVRRELVRGVTLGESPRETARRMINRVQDVFDGGLTRAMVISRTETLDAYRAAAQAAEQANRDVLAGWEWRAQLSARTCRSCWSMHGTMHDIDEPGPLDHHQGRCTRLPVTKTWRQLGFTGIDEPKPPRERADTRFAELGEGAQRRILGSRGYKAWRQGQWPMGEWSERRSTGGWRDSYHPAKPPQPAGGGAAGGRPDVTVRTIHRLAGDPRGDIVVQPGAYVQDHEMATAERLAAVGKSVTFRASVDKQGVVNPDALIDAKEWELKSPEGQGKNTISHQFERARKQAPRLVIDTTRTALDDSEVLSEMVRRLKADRVIVEAMLIDKRGVVTLLARVLS